MSRYIDADKIEYNEGLAIITCIDPHLMSCYARGVTFRKNIDSIPTADVEPVVHAHWEEESRMKIKIADEETDFIERKCSNCHLWSDREILTYYPSPAKRCSLCGAKMDGKENEE